MGVSPPLWKQMVNWSDSSNSLWCLLPYWVNSPQIGCLVCPTQAADFLLSFFFLHGPLPTFLLFLAPCLKVSLPLVWTLPYFWSPCSDIVQSLGSWVADLPPFRGPAPRQWSQGQSYLAAQPQAGAQSGEFLGSLVKQGWLWPWRLRACDQTPTAEKRPSCLPWGKVFQLLAVGLQWHGRDLAPTKEPREASHGPRGLPVASLWFGPLTAQLLGSRRPFPRANVPEGHLSLNCLTVVWFILTWWTVHDRSAQF